MPCRTDGMVPVAPIRVFVVDDHPVVREGIRALLALQPDMVLVGEASDAQEALAKLRQCAAQVVVLDLRMPGVLPTEAIRAIRQASQGVRVLILTAYEDPREIGAALRAGATGFVLKRTVAAHLVEAIRRTAHGLPTGAPQGRNVAKAYLTARELEILELVAKGLSNRGIARTLRISVHTVRAHLNHVFRKLEVEDRTAAVVAALHQGLLFLRR